MVTVAEVLNPHPYERGMILNILSPQHGNSSNGGVSSRCPQVTVTRILDRTGQPGPHTMQPVPVACRVFEPKEDRPEAVLVLMRVAGKLLAHVAPWRADGAGQPLMGGCYVATDDSRWARCVEAVLGHSFYGALPLHDRWEG